MGKRWSKCRSENLRAQGTPRSSAEGPARRGRGQEGRGEGWATLVTRAGLRWISWESWPPYAEAPHGVPGEKQGGERKAIGIGIKTKMNKI